MDRERLGAAYAIVAGTATVAVWAGYALTGTALGQVPAAPGLAFHVAAELATAAVLLAGGALSLRGPARGRSWLLVGLGMLVYALVNALGLYVAWWSRILLGAVLVATLMVLLGLSWPRAAAP